MALPNHRRSQTDRGRYIVTALFLMLLAGLLALDMRWQLSVPDNTRMGPQLYNESFSLHGSTMLFLVSVPIMEAMAFWIVPLMLGTHNMAFPRLGAFSFWLYFGGVLTLWLAHAIGITPISAGLSTLLFPARPIRLDTGQTFGLK